MAKHRKQANAGGRRILLGGLVSAGALVGAAAPALATPVEVPHLPGVVVDVPQELIDKAPPEVKKLLGLDTVKNGSPQNRVAPLLARGERIVSAARSKIGSPYVWGATGPSAFDCSGLVKWSYQQVGTDIPRTSRAQVHGGKAVAKANLKPGDVVAFYGGASHVGVYSGSNKVIHSSTEGIPVREVGLDTMPYYGAARY